MIDGQGWRFRKIGLIVTGEGEREFLSGLFRHLRIDGDCGFVVLRRSSQISPRGTKHQARMLNSGKTIPDRDAAAIGYPALAHLLGGGDFVVVIDDLEGKREDQAEAVVARYRAALDTILATPDQRARAAVHLLVMMLEAYYFADPDATNAVLGTALSEPDSDVEAIRHPKNDLKKLAHPFDEKQHGAQIVARLDVTRILAHPDRCRALRTLMTWCAVALGKPEPTGELYEPTRGQIDDLRAVLA